MSAPLVFVFLSVTNLTWSAYERAQLGTIATRAAAIAALADSTETDAVNFAREQSRAWLGREVAVTVSKNRFAHLTLSLDGFEVSADALVESLEQ